MSDPVADRERQLTAIGARLDPQMMALDNRVLANMFRDSGWASPEEAAELRQDLDSAYEALDSLFRVIEVGAAEGCDCDECRGE